MLLLFNDNKFEKMINYIIILFVSTYMYDVFMVQKEAPISNIMQFIENQQYREDQLRSQCNLNNFMIKSKKNIYETMYHDMKNYLTATIDENIYPVVYNKQIYCDTYYDFIQESENPDNIQNILIYKDKLFTLKNNYPTEWEIELDGLRLVINHIEMNQ